MKLLLSALLRSFWLFAIAALALGLPAQTGTYEDHAAKVNGAIKIGDTKVLDRAVRENPHYALLLYEVSLREKLFTRPDDPELATRLEAVKDSWKRVFNSETLDHVERYLTGSDQKTLIQLDKAVAQLNSLYGQLANVLQNKRKEEMQTLRSQAQAFAKSVEDTGSALRAAEVWLVVWEITKNLPEPSIEERRDAIFAMEQFESFRSRWDFKKDTRYLEAVTWLKNEKALLELAAKEKDKRKDAGYNEDAKGADAFVVPNSTETIAPLEFKPLSALQDDLSSRGGPVPGLWLGGAIKNHGPDKLPWFTRKDLFLRWDKGNAYMVSLNGTETDLKKLKSEPMNASNKLKPTLLHLGDDPRSPQYAFWFYLPSEQEPLFGFNNNLAPTSEKGERRTNLFWKSASSWVATIGGETVTFYDDNCNGELFEEDPIKFGLKDRTLGDPSGDGQPIPAYDSMRIGKGPLQPYSSYVQIAGKWYHMRGKEAGTKVGIRPLNPEFWKTGTVQLKWTAPPNCKLQFLILRGRGDFPSAAFDVAGGKPVEVPVGELEIAYGRIEDGKFPTAMTATVFAGDMTPIKIEAGKTTAITLGQPFKLDWKKDGDTEVTIDSQRFRVLGASGELYTRMNGAAVGCDVMTNKVADTKGAKMVAEFVPITDSEILNTAANKTDLRLEVGFFPIVKGEKNGSTQARITAAKGELVGLVPKKHKLFGVILPVWK